MLKQKIRYLREPVVTEFAKRVKSFSPACFELSEFFDFWMNKFDLFCAVDCEHLIDEGPNSFSEAMRSV